MRTRSASPLLLGSTALLAAGCQPRTTCVATPLEAVPTVLEVAWDGDADGATVEAGSRSFALDGAPGAWSAWVYGFPALTDVAYTVHADGDEVCSGEARTGNLHPDVPDFEVTVHDPTRTSSQPFLLGSTFGDATVPFLLDREGHVVWWLEPSTEMVRPQIRTRGGEVLFLDFPVRGEAREPRLVWTDLAGAELAEAPAPDAHHFFTWLDDGTLFYPVRDIRTRYLESTGRDTAVIGDAIVERSPDGTLRTVFSAWDWAEPPVDLAEHGVTNPAGVEWTHANATVPVHDGTEILFSLALLNVVLRVDRATGEVLDVYGADDGVPYAAGSAPMKFQHDPSFPADGRMLAFTHNADRSATGAVEYALDDGVLREVWSYGLDGPDESPALGQATRLDNGNTLVNQAFLGLVQEVTPEGDVVWELRSGMGASLAQVELVDGL